MAVSQRGEAATKSGKGDFIAETQRSPLI